MRRIPAVGPGQQLGGGSQRRTWARADNGTYQVKLPEPGTNWVLFNELLGVTLATVAGLHPAPSALVELADARFIDNCGNAVEDGTYFGVARAVLLRGGIRAREPVAGSRRCFARNDIPAMR